MTRTEIHQFFCQVFFVKNAFKIFLLYTKIKFHYLTPVSFVPKFISFLIILCTLAHVRYFTFWNTAVSSDNTNGIPSDLYCIFAELKERDTTSYISAPSKIKSGIKKIDDEVRVKNLRNRICNYDGCLRHCRPRNSRKVCQVNNRPRTSHIPK